MGETRVRKNYSCSHEEVTGCRAGVRENYSAQNREKCRKYQELCVHLLVALRRGL